MCMNGGDPALGEQIVEFQSSRPPKDMVIAAGVEIDERGRVAHGGVYNQKNRMRLSEYRLLNERNTLRHAVSENRVRMKAIAAAEAVADY